MTIYGPCTDGFGNVWQVIGPRNGLLAEFYTKKAAQEFIRKFKRSK